MLNVNKRFNQVLNQVNKNYKKEWGYELKAGELIRLWRSGELTLTDSQEDAIIKFTEAHNL